MIEDYNRQINVQKRAIHTLCKPSIFNKDHHLHVLSCYVVSNTDKIFSEHTKNYEYIREYLTEILDHCCFFISWLEDSPKVYGGSVESTGEIMDFLFDDASKKFGVSLLTFNEATAIYGSNLMPDLNLYMLAMS